MVTQTQLACKAQHDGVSQPRTYSAGVRGLMFRPAGLLRQCWNVVNSHQHRFETARSCGAGRHRIATAPSGTRARLRHCRQREHQIQPFQSPGSWTDSSCAPPSQNMPRQVLPRQPRRSSTHPHVLQTAAAGHWHTSVSHQLRRAHAIPRTPRIVRSRAELIVRQPWRSA